MLPLYKINSFVWVFWRFGEGGIVDAGEEGDVGIGCFGTIDVDFAADGSTKSGCVVVEGTKAAQSVEQQDVP